LEAVTNGLLHHDNKNDTSAAATTEIARPKETDLRDRPSEPADALRPRKPVRTLLHLPRHQRERPQNTPSSAGRDRNRGTVNCRLGSDG
jgi:hypothetical protein